MSNNSLATSRDTLAKDVETLKENVLQLAHDIQERSGIHLGETKSKVNDTARFALDQISARPLTILGVGIALGFLFGFFRRSA